MVLVRTLGCKSCSSVSIANIHTRVRRQLSLRSLTSRRIARALDVETGSCAADGAMLVELLHAFVEDLPSKIFGHQIGWVLSPKDFAQLQLF